MRRRPVVMLSIRKQPPAHRRKSDSTTTVAPSRWGRFTSATKHRASGPFCQKRHRLRSRRVAVTLDDGRTIKGKFWVCDRCQRRAS